MTKNKTRMKNKDEIENILLRFKVGQKTLDESTKAICDLFSVSKEKNKRTPIARKRITDEVDFFGNDT